MLTAVPIVIAGVAGAFSVVAAMFNPATWPQTTHMILAAYLVTGLGVAGVYAVALLRGRRDRYPMAASRAGRSPGGELHVGACQAFEDTRFQEVTRPTLGGWS
jgi:hypothetical protein